MTTYLRSTDGHSLVFADSLTDEEYESCMLLGYTEEEAEYL